MGEESKRTEENEGILYPVTYTTDDGVLRKSNNLISAKYKSTLLENKILAIALTRIEVKNDKITATLCPGEIRRLVGKASDTNIYKKLKKVATTMQGHQIMLEDGKGNFKSFAMITNCKYENKTFEMTFNSDMKPYVSRLTPYTPLPMAILMSFEKNTSYRLYELLRKELYRSNKNINNGIVSKEFELNELRYILGLVNTDEAGVKRAVARGDSWDNIFEKVAKEKQYVDWRDFKKHVLEPAKIELKEKSDIAFSYDAVKIGGNRVRRIVFYIQKNEIPDHQRIKILEKAQVIEDEAIVYNKQLSFDDMNDIDIYSKYIGHNGLTREDIQLLMSTASFDASRVEEVIQLADEQEYIANYVGWLIKAIKEEYKKPIAVIKGSSERAEVVKNIQEKYENEKPQLAERTYKKITEKEDFDSFLEYMNLQKEAFEVIYDDVNERVDMYLKYKTNRL